MPEVKSPEQPTTRRPWLVLAIMCIGFFMSLLDGSIVNVAIPTLIHSMNASYDQVLWVIDGYLLLFSVLLITTGRLGDIFGYRRLYVIGIIVFTIASALCGLAGSPAQLLAARLLQGVGGALLFPQVISSILTIFPPQLRGRAFGLFGAIVGFAPIIGPVLGGFLLAHLSWRWIFFINVPIGIATAVLALTFAHATRGPEPRHGRTVRTRHRRHVRHRLRCRHADRSRGMRRGPGGRRPVLFPVQPAQEADGHARSWAASRNHTARLTRR
ncbi:MFS transporter [Streptomyces sp. NPDC003442]